VFLQEVTWESFDYISEKLPDYQCISGYEVCLTLFSLKDQMFYF
jgi:hypothetical protein